MKDSRQKPAAVVFDMDGVLFDTEHMVIKAWQKVADRHGIKDVEKACVECLGLNQVMAEEKFKLQYGEDFPYKELKAEMRAVYWDELYGEHMPVKPGVFELLEALKEHGVLTAVGSSTRSQTVYKELKDAGIFDYFDKIICGDMVQRSKPAPDIFLKACEELSVAPEESYVIEDSFNGIRAGFASGAKVIMVPDILQPTDEVRRQTITVCESLLDVKEYLFGSEERLN